MEQTKNLEELRELHGEDLKEHLLTLTLAERRRVIRELLEAREEIGEPQDDINEDAPN